MLDPTDTWTYGCTVQTLVGQTVVDNVGVVTATDGYGGQDVTAGDLATTQLTQHPVAPRPVPVSRRARVPGSGSSRSPARCRWPRLG